MIDSEEEEKGRRAMLFSGTRWTGADPGGGARGAKAPGPSKWRPRAPKRRCDEGFAGAEGACKFGKIVALQPTKT